LEEGHLLVTAVGGWVHGSMKGPTASFSVSVLQAASLQPESKNNPDVGVRVNCLLVFHFIAVTST
jgi:hypothetical protein